MRLKLRNIRLIYLIRLNNYIREKRKNSVALLQGGKNA